MEKLTFINLEILFNFSSMTSRLWCAVQLNVHIQWCGDMIHVERDVHVTADMLLIQCGVVTVFSKDPRDVDICVTSLRLGCCGEVRLREA